MPVKMTKGRMEALLEARGGELSERPKVDPDAEPGDGSGARVRWGVLNGADPKLAEQVMKEARREQQRIRDSGSRQTGDVWQSVGPARSKFTIDVPTTPQVDLSKFNSGRVRQIFHDPSHPHHFYVATGQGGIWKTNNLGKSWEPISDSLPSQSIGAISMDPSDPQKLYVGFGDPFSAAMPGLARSVNGGKTWSDVTLLKGRRLLGNQSVEMTATQTRDLKVSPDDPKVVMAATNVGLFRSEDAGATFSQVLPPVDLRPGDALAHIGSSWSLGRVGPNSWLVTVRTQATAGQPAGAAILRSDDNGKSWQEVDLGEAKGKVGRMTLAVAESTVGTAATRVYVQAADANNRNQYDILRSDDGGRTFTGLGVNAGHAAINANSTKPNLELMGGQGFYNHMIAVDPENPDYVLAGGNLAAARSNDGGKTWALVSDWRPLASGERGTDKGNSDIYVHADMHSAFIGRIEGKKTVLVGTDGGLFATDDKIFTSNPLKRADGTSELWSKDWKWSDAWNGSDTRSGINSFLFSSVAGSNRMRDANVLGGLQDNGTLVSLKGDPSFDQKLGGDGWEVAVSPVDDKIMLASMNGYHLRSDDAGENWSFVQEDANAGLPASGSPFDVQFATIPQDRVVNPKGLSFLTVVDDEGDPNATSPQAPRGAAYLTTDGGKQWQKAVGEVKLRDGTVMNGIPGNMIEVAASSKHPQTWGVVASQGLEDRVYVTTDGGAHWSESQPVNTEGANQVVGVDFDPSDASGRTYYVATGGSYGYSEAPGVSSAYVYKTTDGGETFTPIGVGDGPAALPKVPVTVVKVDPDNPKGVYVGNVFGVYRSLDAGKTWARLGKNMPFVSVSDLQVTSDNRAKRSGVRAATYGRGIYEIATKGQ